MVPLSKVLRGSSDPVAVKASASYPNLGILNFGRGVFEKPDIEGMKTSAKTLYRVRAGQFICSRLFAFEGAFAVVPPDLDGRFVSNEFPTFDIDVSIIAPGYIGWVFRQPHVWMMAASLGVGLGDRRRRLHPEALLKLSIPLPPLAEQELIVSCLDGVAERMAKRAAAVKLVESELQAMLHAMFRRLAGNQRVRFSKFMVLRPTDTAVIPDEIYHFAGVYSFGRGVFPSVTKPGSGTSYQRLTRLRQGDFVYPKLMAWEGALGIVPPSCDGWFVSPEFPVFDIDKDAVLPELLELHFRDRANWPRSTGTNVRRKRIHPGDFLRLDMPLPPMPQQLILAEACRKVSLAIAAQRTAGQELDKLLPALLYEAFVEGPSTMSRVAA